MVFNELFNNFIRPHVNASFLDVVTASLQELALKNLVTEFETTMGADGEIIVNVRLNGSIDHVKLKSVIEDIKNKRND